MNTQYGNSNLSTSDALEAKFTNASYDGPGKRTNIGDWELDRELSNKDTAIYHNHKTRQTKVANRGSVTKSDWLIADPHIAVGAEKRSGRFKRAIKQTKDAYQKHGYNVSVTGHSLGGSLSNYTTQVLGHHDWYDGSTAFNAGTSLAGKGNYFSKVRRECRRKKNRPKYCDKTSNVYEKNDFVSNRNIACDLVTFGMGGTMCDKNQGYGTIKMYNHKQPGMVRRFSRRFTGIRLFQNADSHRMTHFG